ncbi:MAG: hypothetical protein AAF430_15180 [Myxococcota bacterium]
MPTWLRAIVGLAGLLFLVQALGWAATPERAAEGLGMPLLDGLGRSSQAGDFFAFFLSLATLIGLGALQQRPHWLQAGALMLGSAAIGRLWMWAVHDAAFATQFIVIEAVFAGLLLFAASRAGDATDA